MYHRTRVAIDKISNNGEWRKMDQSKQSLLSQADTALGQQRIERGPATHEEQILDDLASCLAAIF